MCCSIAVAFGMSCARVELSVLDGLGSIESRVLIRRRGGVLIVALLIGSLDWDETVLYKIKVSVP